MFKKIQNWLAVNAKLEEYDEKIHKECEECSGGGIDFIAGRCFECNGNGFINKSRSDIWKDTINNKP